MLVPDPVQVALQGLDGGVREDGDTVAAAFAVPDGDLPPGEVDILDAQSATLQQAEAGAVHQGRHQRGDTVHPRQDCAHLILCEDDRDSRRAAGARGVLEALQRLAEDLSIEEEQGAEGLVLGGCGDLELDREMDEELADLDLPHLLWVSFLVEEDVALDPAEIGPLGAGAGPAEPAGVTDSI